MAVLFRLIGSDLDRFVSHKATGVNVIPKAQGMMATRVPISSISPALAERFNALPVGKCWQSGGGKGDSHFRRATFVVCRGLSLAVSL